MRPGTDGGNASAGTSLNPYPPDKGTELANYGLFATLYNDPGDPESGIGVAGVMALRDMVADLSSSALSITSDAFDSSQITFGLTSGVLDYNLNTGSGTPITLGSFGLDGNSTLNTDSGGGTLTIGGVTAVVVPINLDLYYSDRVLDIVLTDQIGATNAAPLAPVAEPGTIVLGLLGACGVIGLARRKRQAN